MARGGCTSTLEAWLFLEHLTHNRQCLAEDPIPDDAQAADEPLFVESAELVEQDQPLLPLKSHGDAEWRRMAAGGHGCGHHCSQVIVHLGRRDDHAGTRLLNFTADCRIQRYEPDLSAGGLRPGPPRYHRRSRSPALPNSVQS